MSILKTIQKKPENENIEMEKPVETEVIYEEASGYPEYQDAEQSAHLEVKEDQYTEAICYP